jgi:spore coat protein H
VDRVKPKEPVSKKDAARFIQFVQTVNATNAALFQGAIAEMMDVDEFLRFVAVESLLSNMDSPLMTGHNYYLYLDPRTGKFVHLPWDMNEAFGGFRGAGSPSEQMDLSVDQPFSRGNRLAERVLEAPELKARYRQARSRSYLR